MKRRLRIVIVNYRLAGMVAECLRSLESEVGEDVEVVVVDNASPDDSLEVLRKVISENGWDRFTTLIPSPRNGGFAAGNNIGIRPLLGADDPPDYVMLLNPDTTVVPGALRTLMDFMNGRPEVGIAGPRIQDPDGAPQRSAFRFPSLPGELLRGLGLRLASEVLNEYVMAPDCREEPHRIDWVSGAAFMIRWEVIENVGLMDEDYFLYYEETDYCLQVHRAGYEIWYVPDARVVHIAGSSTGVGGSDQARRKQHRLPRYWNESRHRYFQKNYGPGTSAAADIIFATSFASWRLRMRLQGKADLAPPKVVSDLVRYRLEEAGLLAREDD